MYINESQIGKMRGEKIIGLAQWRAPADLTVPDFEFNHNNTDTKLPQQEISNKIAFDEQLSENTNSNRYSESNIKHQESADSSYYAQSNKRSYEKSNESHYNQQNHGKSNDNFYEKSNNGYEQLQSNENNYGKNTENYYNQSDKQYNQNHNKNCREKSGENYDDEQRHDKSNRNQSEKQNDSGLLSSLSGLLGNFDVNSILSALSGSNQGGLGAIANLLGNKEKSNNSNKGTENLFSGIANLLPLVQPFLQNGGLGNLFGATKKAPQNNNINPKTINLNNYKRV